jgi:hypothetical protein
MPWGSAVAAVLAGCVVLAAGAALAGGSSGPPASRAAPSVSTAALERKALVFVGFLEKGRFAEATADFDSTMRAKLPASTLELLWNQMGAQVGPLLETVRLRTESKGDYRTVFVTCRFEKATLDLKLVFDARGRISGFWIAPAAPLEPYRPPAYVDTTTFREIEVTVGDEPWATPGRLVLPVGEGPFPGVVMLGGSGPTDRDETVGERRPFRDLAWGLASRGIATLRFDKRTRSHPSELSEIERFGLEEEYFEDARAALELLAGRPDVDRLLVLGHSLGAWVAPEVARRWASANPPKPVVGVILMAPPGRPVWELVEEQVRYIAALDGTIDEAERRRIDEVSEAVARLRTLDPAHPPGEAILGAPASYWADLARLDAFSVARSLAVPLLILHGGRDYQVTSADLDAWKKALRGCPGVTIRTFPELDHLFGAGEGPSRPEDYRKPVHVDEAVLRTIAEWILER